MAIVRFSKVVQVAGKPDVHLLWMDPAEDSVLKKAEKANRVVTLHQETAGNKTDYGTVGFQKGAAGQVLIFPKSVKAFAEKRIVGVKYDLLESKPIPKSQQAAPPKPPRKKVAQVKATKEIEPKPDIEKKEPPPKVIPFPKEEPHDAAEEINKIRAKVKKAMKALEAGKQVAAFNLLKEIVD